MKTFTFIQQNRVSHLSSCHTINKMILIIIVLIPVFEHTKKLLRCFFAKGQKHITSSCSHNVCTQYLCILNMDFNSETCFEKFLDIRRCNSFFGFPSFSLRNLLSSWGGGCDSSDFSGISSSTSVNSSSSTSEHLYIQYF